MDKATHKKALDQLRELSGGLEAALLLSIDGEIEALSSSDDLEEVAGPILSTFNTMAERATQELGRGGLNLAVLEGDHGCVVAQALPDGRVVAAIAGSTPRLGLLIDDLRACGEQITAGLA